MRLDMLANTVLLAAGLGFAYWASLPISEDQTQRINVIDIPAKTVATMRLSGPDLSVVAERREGGDRYWITYSSTQRVPAPSAATESKASEASSEQGVTTHEERMLSNEKFDELLASFAPLQAERILGQVKEDQYSEFGLDGFKWRFVITQDNGKETHYFLGKKSYGSSNRFIMETDASGKPGRVLLVSDQGFDNFEKAQLRMHDRRLVGVAFEDVTKVTVKSGSTTKRLDHTQKGKDGELVWTDDEEGATAKPSYATWMDKINKLRLAGYATPEQEQQLAGTEPFLEITLEKGGSIVDTMVFRKLPGDAPQYFVTSGFLKVSAHIVTSRAEPIEKDISTIF